MVNIGKQSEEGGQWNNDFAIRDCDVIYEQPLTLRGGGGNTWGFKYELVCFVF